MQYENAQKGIKQIFNAEVLQILATIIAIVGAVVALVGGMSMIATEEITAGGLLSAGIGGLIAIVGGIFAIIGIIMNIVGVANAAKDRDDFKRALLWLLISLAASAVSVFTTSTSDLLSDIFSLVSNLGALFSTLFVIQGVILLAKELGKPEVAEKGERCLKLIVATYVIILIVRVIDIVLNFAGAVAAETVIEGTLSLAALIINIIAYFIYMSMLSKAKKMF